MNFQKIFRHGDVLIFELSQEYESIFNKIEETKQLTLALGEVTGHKHLLEGDLELLKEDTLTQEMIFKVRSSAVLTHQEHDTIVLGKGIYLKVNQVEFDPFLNIIQTIRD